MDPDGLALFARLCGATLARAHARSGDRIAIAAYLGSGDAFDRAIARFAAAYADQNERDHAALAEAVRTGGISTPGRREQVGTASGSTVPGSERRGCADAHCE